MNEVRVDMRLTTPEEAVHNQKYTEIMYKFNATIPRSEEYTRAMNELFEGRIGEGSNVMPPIFGTCLDRIIIGKNVSIMFNVLAMARGGITIEDDVNIAANTQLITNNHDPYDRAVLTCKPIHIKKGAWIGAGSTILPGVTIGKYAIVGACSVVTRDVGDYEVVVGNPAKAIKSLDAGRFE